MDNDDARIREFLKGERVRSVQALEGMISIVKSIELQQLRKAADSFKVGINRVFLLQAFPAAMQRYAQYHCEWPRRIAERMVVFVATHERPPTDEESSRLQKEVQDELDVELRPDLEPVKDSDVFDYRVLEKMVREEAVAMGRDAHNASVVIQAWMCFEILCGDAWIPAVNASPEVLGRNVNKHLPKDERVNWDDLARAGFDVRDKIGGLLARRISFQSLDKIRTAFKNTFPENYAVDLGGVFDDPILLRLEKTRHLLVHKAGRVDEAFAKANRHDPFLGAVPVGEELKISNVVTTDFWTTAANAGGRLLTAVNSWLLKNVEYSKLGATSDYEI
jgi:hypothetical protein